MAEVAVGMVVEVMLGKLVTLAEEQISLVRHFKDDLETLEGSLTIVQAFLSDAEKKKVTSSAVKVWLRQLEGLVFDADNVIDEIDYFLLSKKAKRSQNKKVPISYRKKMGSRIKVINERLEKINQRARDFGLERRLAREKDILDAYGDRETDAFFVDPIFLGRENEVSEIVNMLITTSKAEQKSSVLPIVGMGGQGKTTFARKVFNDERIISHFGEKNLVWVYVSQNFDVRNILKNIQKSFLSEENVEPDSKQVLLQKLQKHCGGEKYLLVLDDVWNEDRVKWDGFVNSLSGISSANGYCMIVTTRSEEVASIVEETLPVYKLKGLPEDDCWSIIKGKAFIGGDISFDVEEIGKSIAKKCQGVPLAANVVGGLLSSMKSKDEWKSIEENWLPDDENPISNVLKLSFDNLPSASLKKCFAYCSIFPKGYEIDKEQLVELWMAEGFLQTNHQKSNNNVNMETTGGKNLNILLWNSLLQNVRCDDYGNVTHCNMHDLVHDLASSVLCEGVCKIRYIGYKPSGDGFKSIPTGQERYVRTLFFDGEIFDINFSNFESLHTLTLVDDVSYNLPTSIRELKHLRYLDISKTCIQSVPDWISELHHLQTFRSPMEKYPRGQMRSYLEKLPDSLSYLVNLKHLHIPDDTTLPPEIGKLTCLQTLPYIHVGGKKGCGISELGKLKYLKGELEVRNLGKVRDENEAKSANLLQKQGIYKLKLVWGESRKGQEAKEESVLEGLHPHPNLKSLSICGYKGKILPPWTSKMAVQHDGHYSEGLANLMEIELTDCSECEELPMLGHLQNLKSLKLNGLTNLKSIGPSFYGINNRGNNISNNGVCTINVVVFPALKRLELSGMPNLEKWDKAGDLPSEVVVFPCLEYLEIQGCNQLISAPSHLFPCLKELRIADMESGLPLENICGMKLSSLTHLAIWGIKELKCLPDGLFSSNHNALEKLLIWGCPDLKSIPTEMLESCALSLDTLSLNGLSSLTNTSEVINGCLPKMTRLTSLYIEGVPKFSIIGSAFQMASSLKTLIIGPSSSDCSWNNVSFNETFDSMLLQFTSLVWLELSGMEDWECLPDGIQHLTSLESLLLINFGIEALPEWFGNLSSSLEKLGLFGCKKLRHFPSEQAMQRLSKLKSLNIFECPLLLIKEKRWKLTSLCIWGCPLLLTKEERMNTDNPFERPHIVESEWPKIFHIPTIFVDDYHIESQSGLHPESIARRWMLCCLHYPVRRVLGFG